MKKNKKSFTALVFSFVLVFAITASASSLGERDTTLIYVTSRDQPGYATESDYAVTATADGTIREDHYLANGQTPTSFSAKLMHIRPWYEPNKLVDTSTHANGYNQGNSENGERYKTDLQVWGWGESIVEHTDYTQQ